MALFRIKINLATFSYKNKGLEWGFIVLVCVFVLGISAYLIHMAATYQEEILAYSNKMARLERTLKREGGAGKAQIRIDQEKMRELESGLSFVQNLILRDIFPWDMVLDAIERNMPKGVYLDKMEGEVSSGKLELQGAAKSMTEISVLLKNLDLNEIFRSSQLVGFSVEDGKNGPPGAPQLIHFDIECNLDSKVIMEKLRSWTRPPKGASKRQAPIKE